MALLLEKINIDFTDRVILLAALYQVENFKLYTKYHTFLARHLGLLIKKIFKKDITLQLNGIWQYYNLLDFIKLVCKNPEQF